MATNAIVNQEERIDCPPIQASRLSEKEAAKRLIELTERNMARKGLSEIEKNRRVGRFAAFVDTLISSFAKR